MSFPAFGRKASATPPPRDHSDADEGKTDALRRLDKDLRSSTPSPPPPARSITPVTIGKKAHVHHHRTHSHEVVKGVGGKQEEEDGGFLPLVLPRLPTHQSSTGSGHGRRASGGGGGGGGSYQGGSMGHSHSNSSLSALGEISRQLSQSFHMSLDLVKASLGEELVYCQICREYEGTGGEEGGGERGGREKGLI